MNIEEKPRHKNSLLSCNVMNSLYFSVNLFIIEKTFNFNTSMGL